MCLLIAAPPVKLLLAAFQAAFLRLYYSESCSPDSSSLPGSIPADGRDLR